MPVSTNPHGQTHQPGAVDDILHLMGSLPSAAVDAVPRVLCAGSQGMTSGNALFTYFSSPLTLAITTLQFNTAGAATPTTTLCRYGLYTVAANGDITLVAATASDITLLAAGSTLYPKVLAVAGDLSTVLTTYTLQRGTRYAMGLVWVGTTPPNLKSATGSGQMNALTPVLSKQVGSQSDLPTSVANASGTTPGTLIWGRLS